MWPIQQTTYLMPFLFCSFVIAISIQYYCPLLQDEVFRQQVVNGFRHIEKVLDIDHLILTKDWEHRLQQLLPRECLVSI